MPRSQTTLPKAKELRHLADEVIGYAKRGGGRNDVYGRQLASRVVRENPVVMLGWAAIITVTMVLSMVPAFLGLIFTLPILGHTTWHLYQRAVSPVEG